MNGHGGEDASLEDDIPPGIEDITDPAKVMEMWSIHMLCKQVLCVFMFGFKPTHFERPFQKLDGVFKTRFRVYGL